jgi:hypothetical protein
MVMRATEKREAQRRARISGGNDRVGDQAPKGQ